MLFWRNWSSSQYLGGRSASQFSDGSFLFAPDPEESLSQMINRTLTDDTASPDEDLDSVLFGNLRGNVVGMRYYTGVVSNNEMVALQREPNNPYDRNAVQVNNVNGIQVGHIKRELAAPLAFILDNRLARVEGVVPYGANNVFTMPVQLSFWGREENRDAVLERLKRHGFKLAPPTKGSLLGGGIAEAWSGMGSARPGPSYKAPVHTAVQMTVEQLKNEFDKIFEDLKEHDKTREMEPAKAVCTPLLPHQKQALAWMVLRENNTDLPPFWEQRNGMYYNLLTNFAEKERPENVRGGILADDMGLGKTLSTIAVILTNFHQGKPLPTEKFTPGPVMEEEPSGFADALGKSSACKANEELSNTFKMQTGADNRNKATVIDTTGSITSSGSKPHSSSYPKRKKTENVKYTYSSDSEKDEENISTKKKVKTQQKSAAGKRTEWKATSSGRKGTTESQSQSSCGLMEDIDFAAALGGTSSSTLKKIKKGCPSSQPSSNTAANAKARATLIVCPLSVLSNWIDQFERHLCPDVKLNMYLYYGSERNKTASFLAAQDIVLTTYNTLTVDYGSGSASPLHKVKWLRVVLDEGHTIRNPNAQQTKAALTLTAERRWVLTGTPIQNSLKDLWSILSFLKLKPFTDRQWWHRTIQRPVTMGDQHGLKRLQALIKNITLRRTKASKVNGKPVIELPERTVFVQHITLTDEEKQIYESVKNEGRAIIGRYFSEGSVFTHYADVLAILVWLRQLCCHPRLFANSSAVMGSSDNATPDELREKLLKKMKLVLSCGSDEECAICLESLTFPVITHCAHVYCRPCICQVIQSEQPTARCPLCRAEIRVEQLVECPPEEADVAAPDKSQQIWVSSSKVDALMHSLIELRKQDPTIKSLVVSQFTAFLTLIETPLRQEGFAFTRLDGSMPQKRRINAIESFQSSEPGSPTVMLLSLKAGGVGLNLTAASRVFLMDPAWNPAAEDQCFDRCHRLGQTRDVVITKFIVKNSVEENMIKIQNKKRELAAGAFGTKRLREIKQSRIEEIKILIDV
ncbi:helicase-like transcription factor isoform X1 [Hemiscyllium ocellatum]|uniref:helicase-like transcription factor isoform X1 n=1 Tax=Hemiscyllium ocellatum TaxID=170820 RepID=UPI002966AB3E|nr:helicase-like transcription factor isoform X1 [Hemiscyllium ocellatum]XP_060690519.1 helicase-like transcription factor isoform X1 [Hemiscyllium ocellatum]